jgi:hypothetical protein
VVLTVLPGFIMLLVGSCASLPFVAIAGGVLLILSYAATWITARFVLPRSVDFGHLKTFRDLALVIAKDCRR